MGITKLEVLRCEWTFTSSLVLSTKCIRPTLSLYVNNACHLQWLWKSHSNTMCDATEPQCAPIHGRGLPRVPETYPCCILQRHETSFTYRIILVHVHGLREKIAEAFLKNSRKTLNSPNSSQQDLFLLDRLKKCLSR